MGREGEVVRGVVRARWREMVGGEGREVAREAVWQAAREAGSERPSGSSVPPCTEILWLEA